VAIRFEVGSRQFVGGCAMQPHASLTRKADKCNASASLPLSASSPLR